MAGLQFRPLGYNDRRKVPQVRSADGGKGKESKMFKQKLQVTLAVLIFSLIILSVFSAIHSFLLLT
jgi:hypothetical protein